MTEMEHGRYTVELVLRTADGASVMRWDALLDVNDAERELAVGGAIEEAVQKLHQLLYADGPFGEVVPSRLLTRDVPRGPWTMYRSLAGNAAVRPQGSPLDGGKPCSSVPTRSSSLPSPENP